jgi:hypothetical protein
MIISDLIGCSVKSFIYSNFCFNLDETVSEELLLTKNVLLLVEKIKN